MSGLESLPRLAEDGGKALTAKVREAMDAAGLVRDHENRLAGAENTGWTDAYGSTGFSVGAVSPLMPGGKKYGADHLLFHVVVSGKKCGIRYRRVPIDTGDDVPDWGHEPENAERLLPQIKRVFQGLGFEVAEVRYGGAQMYWDDDVSYHVVVKRPEVLGPEPRPYRRRGW